MSTCSFGKENDRIEMVCKSKSIYQIMVIEAYDIVERMGELK